MTKTVLNLIAALAFSIAAASAQALVSVNPNVDLDPVAVESSNQLDDLMSPEEIATELGIDEAVVEPMSYSSARLQIVVDKSRRVIDRRTGRVIYQRSPTAQTMLVYLDGQLIHNFPVSTGRETPELAKSGKRYFSRTPTGTFRIQRRVVNHWSQTWQARMPFAQFFIGGIAIHATTADHYHELGSRASGGCVRLRYDHAQIMWNLVAQVGVGSTTITVQNPGND